MSTIYFLSSARFYSFLMDGSTDAGNVEDEAIVILYSTRDEATQEIRSCARFLSVEVSTKADGLLNCLGRGLSSLGIANILDKSRALGVTGEPILVGGGTDGTLVNVEHNGMKGKLQHEFAWVS